MTAIRFNLVAYSIFLLFKSNIYSVSLELSWGLRFVACIYFLHLTRTHNFFSSSLLLTSFSTHQCMWSNAKNRIKLKNENNYDYQNWLQFRWFFFCILLSCLLSFHFVIILIANNLHFKTNHTRQTLQKSKPSERKKNTQWRIYFFFLFFLDSDDSHTQTKDIKSKTVALNKWKTEKIWLFSWAKLGTEQSTIKLNERVGIKKEKKTEFFSLLFFSVCSVCFLLFAFYASRVYVKCYTFDSYAKCHVIH